MTAVGHLPGPCGVQAGSNAPDVWAGCFGHWGLTLPGGLGGPDRWACSWICPLLKGLSRLYMLRRHARRPAGGPELIATLCCARWRMLDVRADACRCACCAGMGGVLLAGQSSPGPRRSLDVSAMRGLRALLVEDNLINQTVARKVGAKGMRDSLSLMVASATVCQ